MFSDKRQNSGESSTSRPSSSTRSVRCSFSAEFEVLPPEIYSNNEDLELCEEIAPEVEEEIDDVSSINGIKQVEIYKSESPVLSCKF